MQERAISVLKQVGGPVRLDCTSSLGQQMHDQREMRRAHDRWRFANKELYGTKTGSDRDVYKMGDVSVLLEAQQAERVPRHYDPQLLGLSFLAQDRNPSYLRHLDEACKRDCKFNTC